MSERSNGSRDIDAAVREGLANLVRDEPLADDEVSQAIVSRVLRPMVVEAASRRQSIGDPATISLEPDPGSEQRTSPWQKGAAALALGSLATAVGLLIVLRGPPDGDGQAGTVPDASRPEQKRAPVAVLDVSEPATPVPSCWTLEEGGRLCVAPKAGLRKPASIAESRPTDAQVRSVGEDANPIGPGSASVIVFEAAGLVAYAEGVDTSTSRIERGRPNVEAPASPRKRPRMRRVEPSAAEVLGQARRQLTNGRTREAAKTYETLLDAYPRSPEAKTATIALANLYLHELERPKRAEHLFRRYLKGRGGPLALEARSGRIRALAQLGQKDEEASAISEFLRYHGSSGLASTLRARLETLRGQGAPRGVP